jgi:hypothetical protein
MLEEEVGDEVGGIEALPGVEDRPAAGLPQARRCRHGHQRQTAAGEKPTKLPPGAAADDRFAHVRSYLSEKVKKIGKIRASNWLASR